MCVGVLNPNHSKRIPATNRGRTFKKFLSRIVEWGEGLLITLYLTLSGFASLLCSSHFRAEVTVGFLNLSIFFAKILASRENRGRGRNAGERKSHWMMLTTVKCILFMSYD